MYEMCYLRHDKNQRIDQVCKVAIKMYFRKMSNHNVAWKLGSRVKTAWWSLGRIHLVFFVFFVLLDVLLLEWKIITILSEDFLGFSELTSRLKLVSLNLNRTYLIKFVPSVGFSIILPKHPSSRTSWWLKRPPFNKRMLWSGPPLPGICPVVMCLWTTTCPLMGGLVSLKLSGLCLFLKQEMRN